MSHRAEISFFMVSSRLIARHARETSGRLAPAAHFAKFECSSRWTSGGKSEGRGCRCPIGASMRASGACNVGLAFWLTATPAADKRGAPITLTQIAKRRSLWGGAPALPLDHRSCESVLGASAMVDYTDAGDRTPPAKTSESSPGTAGQRPRAGRLSARGMSRGGPAASHARWNAALAPSRLSANPAVRAGLRLPQPDRPAPQLSVGVHAVSLTAFSLSCLRI